MKFLIICLAIVLALLYWNPVILRATAEETVSETNATENGTDRIAIDTNHTSEEFVNDTTVSIDVIKPEETEEEAEERRQAAEGGALNICEEPASTDQFLFLFIFTDQCYAYSGSGPRWAAMTGWAFDEDAAPSSITKRISAVGRPTKNAQAGNESTTTIYSCGNGKKLPSFAPIVHILNASWFLHASTSSKEEKEKEKEKEGEEKKDGEVGKNETISNETVVTTAANETTVDKKALKPQNKSNPDEDWCMMVNFYAPSCPFSARLAPFYNALPRVFPKLLYIAAVDATESSRLNLIYGVAGTPTVMLFHNGKPVARLDDGEYALQRLVSFITQRTDLKPLLNVDVENEDLQGPLPSVPIRGFDYYLILAWIFLIACAIYYGARSSVAQRIWEAVCRNWREMEEEQEGLQAAGR